MSVANIGKQSSSEKTYRESNEDPQSHREALLSKLTSAIPPSSGPVIAVDLDDVLCQTNHTVAQWHNETYGTNMTLEHFYYYYYWKNPFWGPPAETTKKLAAFYATDRLHNAPPVPGAREGVQALRDMGYRLIIITARDQDITGQSWDWVQKHFPDLFDTIICTGHFRAMFDEDKTGHEVVFRLSKADICTRLDAQLLIDDSAENTLECVTSDPPVRTLLFGNYEWNKRTSSPSDMRDDMAHDRRLSEAGGREYWKEESIDVPHGAPLWRTRDWSEAVRWIEKARNEEIIL